MKDRHHILHHRKEWTLRADSELLRETKSLVPLIERDVHEEIHRVCPAVPLLGYHALARTVQLFKPSGKTMEDIERLQTAIERSTEHPKAHDIEKRMGDLAIWAIDLQANILRHELDGSNY